MQVVVLASGSRGNAVYVEMDGARILIDAGISARRIRQGLAAEGIDIKTLDGVLLTHEHRDHTAGLRTLLKQYQLPLFSRQATLAQLAMEGAGALPEACLHAVAEAFSLAGICVAPFSISHDAADPVGWRLVGSERFTLATDLGFVTETVQASIEGADVLVLEANHDAQLLQGGSYPWPLKRRILSNRGHLANTDAAWALARLKKRPRRVVLAHLSEENNRPALAKETVERVLAGQGIHVPLTLASQDEAVKLT